MAGRLEVRSQIPSQTTMALLPREFLYVADADMFAILQAQPLPERCGVGPVQRVGQTLDAVGGQLSIARDIKIRRNDGTALLIEIALGAVQVAGEAAKGGLRIQREDGDAKMFPRLVHDLLVQVAGGDDERGLFGPQTFGVGTESPVAGFGFQVAGQAEDVVGGVADFEQKPKEDGPCFAEAGVPRQDEAVMQRGPREILPLESFKFHGGFTNRNPRRAIRRGFCFARAPTKISQPTPHRSVPIRPAWPDASGIRPGWRRPRRELPG